MAHQLAASHAASLLRAIGAPAVAVRSDGTSLIVGQGIQSFRPGGAVANMVSEGQGVAVEPGVTIRGDVVRLYGGHPEGEDHGALTTIEDRSALTGAVIASAVPIALPFARRGICAVRRGKNDVLFGGINSDGQPIRDVLISRDGGPPRQHQHLRLPSSSAYLSAGRRGEIVYLLGAASQSWPGKEYLDVKASISESGDPALESVAALTGKSHHGMTAIHLPSDRGGFLAFGGYSAMTGGGSSELWVYTTADSTPRLLGAVTLDGEPWTAGYCGGVWSESESAVFLIGGTRFRAGAPSVAESRILRVPVTL